MSDNGGRLLDATFLGGKRKQYSELETQLKRHSSTNVNVRRQQCEYCSHLTVLIFSLVFIVWTFYGYIAVRYGHNSMIGKPWFSRYPIIMFLVPAAILLIIACRSFPPIIKLLYPRRTAIQDTRFMPRADRSEANWSRLFCGYPFNNTFALGYVLAFVALAASITLASLYHVAYYGSWFDVNGCSWACPYAENCHNYINGHVRLNRTRGDGLAISNFFFGSPVTGLTAEIVTIEDYHDDVIFKGFIAQMRMSYNGKTTDQTLEAVLRMPIEYAHPGVIIIVDDERTLTSDNWVVDDVAVLRIDPVETLNSNFHTGDMGGLRSQVYDLGHGRSVLRTAIETEGDGYNSINAGSISLNADAGLAVIEGLKDKLEDLSLTRRIASGCSRGGKQAMRMGTVDTGQLTGVWSHDAGSLGTSLESIHGSCAESSQILAHPLRWARWARAGLWHGNDATSYWNGYRKTMGDMDSVIKYVVDERNLELHIYQGEGLSSWAGFASAWEWTENKARLWQTISYKGEHCNVHNAHSRKRMSDFVKGKTEPELEQPECPIESEVECGRVAAWLKTWI